MLDGELVDMDFGTGAVKITPAHDPNDYECGKRNKLEMITIFTLDGRVNDKAAPEFTGMMRYDARAAVAKALDAKGLYRGKEFNKMKVPFCSRSKDVIEPMLTPQWFVNCKPAAAKACEWVRPTHCYTSYHYHYHYHYHSHYHYCSAS